MGVIEKRKKEEIERTSTNLSIAHFSKASGGKSIETTHYPDHSRTLYATVVIYSLDRLSARHWIE